MTRPFASKCRIARWGLGLCLATAAWAAPVTIGQFDFGSGSVTLDFLGIVPGAPVDAFYSDPPFGVQFSPGFYGENLSGVVTNRLNSLLLPEFPLQIDFLFAPLVRFGFEISGTDGDLLTLTLLDDFGNPLGNLDYVVGSSFQFTGLAEPGGFRSVVIHNLSFGEGQILISHLQFEAISDSVPEPGTGLLTATGAAVWATYLRRNRR